MSMLTAVGSSSAQAVLVMWSWAVRIRFSDPKCRASVAFTWRYGFANRGHSQKDGWIPTPILDQMSYPDLEGGQLFDVRSALAFCPVMQSCQWPICCFAAQTKRLNGEQLLVEGRLPMSQSLDAPQLQHSWGINVRLQWMF